MYYVIYVGSGREETMEQLIRSTVPETLFTRCFHPVRHMKKKIHGQWTEKYERLIPGYVFVETDDIRAFYRKVRELPAFLKLLGKETTLSRLNEEEVPEEHFIPLPSEEERWLKRVSGIIPGIQKPKEKSRPVVELTKVRFDEEGKLQILSGPLKEFSGEVRKIDVHRRYAEVEVVFMGRKTLLHLGIELIP